MEITIHYRDNTHPTIYPKVSGTGYREGFFLIRQQGREVLINLETIRLIIIDID
jgi:hypothetical protein